MQAVVEGVGGPVAIGATGVLLLTLDALDLGIGAVIVFGLVLAVIWLAVAARVYRSYTRALADEMRRRSSVDGLDLADHDATAIPALLRSEDARDVRLGLDLLAGVASPASEVELRRVAEHADSEVRVRALGQLAANGDARAAADAASLVRDLAHSGNAIDRRAAAAGLAWRGFEAVDGGLLVALLEDPDASVRAAALDAVAPGDAVDSEVVRRVVEALGEARTAGRATAALRRLGDAAVPVLVDALARDGAPRHASLVRAAAVAATDHGFVVVAPALSDPNRTVVLAALDALDAAGTHDVVPPDVLEGLLDDAAALAAHAVAARTALAEQESPLLRALDDEIDLARRLVIAVLALRHGDRIRAAVRVVEHGQGSRRALGVEALDVVLPVTRPRSRSRSCGTTSPWTRGRPRYGATYRRPAARRSGSRTSRAIRRVSGARRGLPNAHVTRATTKPNRDRRVHMKSPVAFGFGRPHH